MECLYNGIKLPALPEWDRETYSYAFISNEIFDNVIFYALSRCPSTNGTATEKGTIVNPYGDDIPYVRSILNADGNSWGELSEGYLGTEGQISLPFWANFDVLYSDGTLYLAASDPIPLSTFTPDPMSLTMGWIVGRRIAGQRGKKIEVPEEEKTPIAYLYPSVVLPDINAFWDKTKYPYAYMDFESFAPDVLLILSADPLRVYEDHSGCENDAAFQQYLFENGGEWHFESESDSGDSFNFSGNGWASHNIYVYDSDADTFTDEVVLSAFTPVPTSDGMVCYKGAVLPDINAVWTDKEKYPYAAIIGYSAEQDWVLCLSPLPFMFENGIFLDDWSNARVQLAEPLDGGWWLDNGTTDLGGEFTDSLWTSHDILNTDGTTYLAASEPVPVYE